MDCRSLGERGSNYTKESSSSLHQMKQKDKSSKSKDKAGSGAGGFAAGLLAGAGVGVVAGLLLAPEKGTAMRRKVTESAKKYGDQVNDWTKKMNKGGQTDAHVNEAPDLPPTTATGRAFTSTGGPAQKSPYTDTDKRSDSDVKNMINDPRNPGGPTTPPTTGGPTTPPATGGPTPTTPPRK